MDILFGRSQLPVIVAFLVCGVIAGAVYDVFKIKRRIFGANYIVLFIDDFIFMFLCTILVIFCAFATNNGNMKWYELPLMVSGFYVYRKTLSVLFIKVAFFLIDKTKLLLKFLLRPVKRLLEYFGHFICKGLERLYLTFVYIKMKRKFMSFRM